MNENLNTTRLGTSIVSFFFICMKIVIDHCLTAIFFNSWLWHFWVGIYLEKLKYATTNLNSVINLERTKSLYITFTLSFFHGVDPNLPFYDKHYILVIGYLGVGKYWNRISLF